MVPRRTFLRALAVASAATALGARGAAGAPRATAVAPADLSLATFSRLRGAEFAVSHPGAGSQRCVLASVESHERGPGLENFSLRFDGPADGALSGGICQFAHPELGTCEIFVVAKRLDAATCGYEAVFNRLT